MPEAGCSVVGILRSFADAPLQKVLVVDAKVPLLKFPGFLEFKENKN